MPSWVDRLRSWLGRVSGRRQQPDVYHSLRSMALAVDPASIDVPDDAPWSGAAVAAMEIGLRHGIATVVAIADGTVSLYLSSGGGVLGAGPHAAVRGAADQFRMLVAESRSLLVPTDDFQLPDPGQVRFHARTADGAYSASAPEEALRAGRHPLSPLYAAAQDLLTEIRMSTPAMSGPMG